MSDLATISEGDLERDSFGQDVVVEPRLNPEEFKARIAELKRMARQASSEEEARQIVSRIARIARAYRVQNGIGVALNPALQALELDPGYRIRPHIGYLADKIAEAVRDVERGISRRLIVSMPPRAGKSTLTSLYTPLWILRRHPEWKIMMASYDGALTRGWAKQQRTLIEDKPGLGVALQRDGGAGGVWSTMEKGGMFATGVGGAMTGRGAKVMLIDDPIADFVSAHSPRIRDNLWNWWLSVAQTRLEPPSLVIVVMTRWHEDDFVGRLLSKEYEGDPSEWEEIVLPAIADRDAVAGVSVDPLGREKGQPLYSPLPSLDNESEEDARRRWEKVKVDVGTYTFSAMYQQRPAPQKGAIFDAGWWRFWTTDPARATEDGRIVFLDPGGLVGAQWLDSWDTAFKASEDSSYVVAQRWAKQGPNRYLIAQKRNRWSFTKTLKEMQAWAEPNDHKNSPYGNFVHKRLIEEKANGAAIIDTLREEISGMKAINPKTSKEARARSITPEVESGHVYLPHPLDPGNEWVPELLSELRNFPHDTNDDQVDSLTQALEEFRDPGIGGLTVPGRVQGPNPTGIPRRIPGSRTAAANTMGRRIPGR
ncbi:terminase large subunit [Microbacterium phage Hendrix]|uniref:Terminase n=1 Tax=Microbacterium phage Hendrix TaxID=2182341 RepID=A0A2U8UUI6_9CAUD|nr:terminase large subunit [Microbacterium phage Hendrix]AWN07676.1 terminase [Microbacterium phage Hendrix]